MTNEECQFRIMIKVLSKRTTKSLPCVNHTQKGKPVCIFSYQLELALEIKKYLIITIF